MTTHKLDLTRTRAALAQFDAGKPARDKMLDDAQTDAEVVAWDDAEQSALRVVRLAFYDDSKDRNRRDNCMLAGLRWLCQLCAEAV